jgi:biopolymer transport protein ExbD
MRFATEGRESGFPAMGNTPFIDVIFQLVLFFVFTLSFLLAEQWLPAPLPKQGGPGEPDLLDRRVALDLSWSSAGGGFVVCSTGDYRPATGGFPLEDSTFPPDPASRTVLGSDGLPHTTARVVLESGRSGVKGPVTFDYGIPHLAAVERFLEAENRRQQTLLGRGVSVTVRFDDRVPWQAVVTVADICRRVGITDYALGSLAPEP